MDEEKETQPSQEQVEGKQEKKTEETLSIVDEAKKIRDEIKEENDRREELLMREENMKAEAMLGGRADAGEEKKKKEMSDKEYAEAAVNGTLEKNE